MGKSFAETATAVFLKETAASETLKPKSKPAEPPQTLGGPATVIDGPKAPTEGSNNGEIAASVLVKDTSTPTKTAKKVSQSVSQAQPDIAEEKEVQEEDLEISEELKKFIDSLVAEGKTEEEIIAAIDENFEVVEETVEEETKSETAVAAPVAKIDMSEHINALFEGEDLSEDFKSKATIIFEAAVREQLEQEVAAVEAGFNTALAEEVAKIQENLAGNVDDYLNYVIEQWVAENEIAIETGLRTELTEDFISGLRNLFAENYIDIPEDKVSVVEELSSKVAELESKLNEEIENNVALNSMLAESKKTEVLSSLTEGLTVTQAEKLVSLAEGINYKDEASFSSKVKTLRENYFPTNVKVTNTLDIIEPGTEGKSMLSEEIAGPMKAYVKALGKSLPSVKE